MVNLKEISTADLFQELANRPDGRAYIECVVAGLKMQNCAKSIQEKVGENILEFMQEYFARQQEYYQERFRENWWEAMKQDEIEHYLLEDKDLAKLVFEYMALTLE